MPALLEKSKFLVTKSLGSLESKLYRVFQQVADEKNLKLVLDIFNQKKIVKLNFEGRSILPWRIVKTFSYFAI